ncbi:MAG: MFS transporter [Oceanospirillaceae bacterium]|nr:MFS transporter [Oceanospirillaceae bacterium]
MSQDQTTRTWGETIALIFHKKVLVMLFLGFSAGLPILLIFSSLSLWLKDAEVSRSTITFFSWAALGYSFKFIWAPLVDNLSIPGITTTLGRRRGWILLSQIAIIISILAMAFSEPTSSLTFTAIAAVMLGFSSATQDIVIDAYRIESAKGDMQSMLSSAYIAGYRIGMIVAGAGALYIAGWLGTEGTYSPNAWTTAYVCMAVAMLIGVATTLCISEPTSYRPSHSIFDDNSNVLKFLLCFIICVAVFIASFTLIGPSIKEFKAWLLSDITSNKRIAGFIAATIKLWLCIGFAVVMAWVLIRLKAVPKEMLVLGYVNPVKDFFVKYGKTALLVILLIGLYRISDIVMGVIANLFYSDLGFSKIEIAAYSKTYGLIATIAGGFLGGAIAIRYGVYKALLTGAILSAATNILFAFMVDLDKSGSILFMTITADNISGGIATAAFVAYLSSLTSVSFTAMQYAIFSSFMTLFPKLLAGYSGAMSIELGYQQFFYLTALMGIPAVFLVVILSKLVPVEKLN